MEIIQLDASIAIGRGKVDEAVDRIAAWDSVAAKLPIGVAIRGALPTPSQRKVTRDLRSKLQSTRKFLEEGDLKSARKAFVVALDLLSETKDSFEGSL